MWQAQLGKKHVDAKPFKGFADAGVLEVTSNQDGSAFVRLIRSLLILSRRVSKSVFVSGETTLIGRVQRVGGATKMRCALRVEGIERLLFCDVASQEVSRQLGAKIYQEVEARGIAKWFQRSWTVFEFRIESIGDAPARKPLREALEALRQAGGKAWESVEDPEGLLQELRR